MAIETIIERDAFYVGGSWVPSSGTGTQDVIEPATEQVIGRIPMGTADDVDQAVVAARLAFEDWSRTPVAVRAELLEAIAAGLAARADELAALITREVGMPLMQSRMIQAGLPVTSFASLAALLESYPFEEREGNSLIVREPVGVVGAITPWNYPLHQIAAKVSAALGAGCTIVVKPSEVTPLNAFLLAEVIHEAGVPAGVFNLVTGTGPEVGEALVVHPGIDMVSFTGSTAVGRRIGALAAQTVKRVALELGGKSPNVILDDADMVQAVTGGMKNCYLNSGQTCSALTRMLVPRERLPEVEAIAAAVAEHFIPGDPFDEATTLGPLVSEAQRERVRGFIRDGEAEGARIVTGGAEAPDGLERGWFVRPTVFSDVTPDMKIAREEIFGPVLVLIPYEDEEDAIRKANDTIYGLAGGVWSGDPERAQAVARRLRAGQIEINGATFNPVAPFGGYKQSGIGREFGRHGLEEFLETKSLQL